MGCCCNNSSGGNYTYVVYASDKNGSNFSLIKNSNNIQRCYQAIYISNTELDINSPTFPNFFTGKYYNICGEGSQGNWLTVDKDEEVESTKTWIDENKFIRQLNGESVTENVKDLGLVCNKFIANVNGAICINHEKNTLTPGATIYFDVFINNKTLGYKNVIFSSFYHVNNLIHPTADAHAVLFNDNNKLPSVSIRAGINESNISLIIGDVDTFWEGGFDIFIYIKISNAGAKLDFWNKGWNVDIKTDVSHYTLKTLFVTKVLTLDDLQNYLTINTDQRVLSSKDFTGVDNNFVRTLNTGVARTNYKVVPFPASRTLPPTALAIGFTHDVIYNTIVTFDISLIRIGTAVQSKNKMTVGVYLATESATINSQNLTATVWSENISSVPSISQIRIGLKDGKFSIILGDVTSTWGTNTIVLIDTVKLHYTGSPNDSWNKGYTIDELTDLSSYTNLTDIPTSVLSLTDYQTLTTDQTVSSIKNYIGDNRIVNFQQNGSSGASAFRRVPVAYTGRIDTVAYTGMLSIKHPLSANTSTITVKLLIYDAANRAKHELLIGCYSTLSAISTTTNLSAVVYNDKSLLPTTQVRGGVLDGNLYLILGDETTTWSAGTYYMLEYVDIFNAGSINENWNKDWTVEKLTNTTGMTLVTIPVERSDLNNLPNSFMTLTTDQTFTSQKIASGYDAGILKYLPNTGATNQAKFDTAVAFKRLLGVDLTGFITLKRPIGANSTFLKLNVMISEIDSGANHNLDIDFYYTNGEISASYNGAYLYDPTGNFPTSVVRAGVSDGYIYILIGEINTTWWARTEVFLNSIKYSSTGTSSDLWNKGWTIESSSTTIPDGTFRTMQIVKNARLEDLTDFQTLSTDQTVNSTKVYINDNNLISFRDSSVSANNRIKSFAFPIAHVRFDNQTGIITLRHPRVALGTFLTFKVFIRNAISGGIGNKHELSIGCYYNDLMHPSANLGTVIYDDNNQLPSKLVRVATGQSTDNTLPTWREVMIMIGDVNTNWTGAYEVTVYAEITANNSVNDAWNNNWTLEMLTALTETSSLYTSPVREIAGKQDVPNFRWIKNINTIPLDIQLTNEYQSISFDNIAEYNTDTGKLENFGDGIYGIYNLSIDNTIIKCSVNIIGEDYTFILRLYDNKDDLSIFTEKEINANQFFINGDELEDIQCIGFGVKGIEDEIWEYPIVTIKDMFIEVNDK